MIPLIVTAVIMTQGAMFEIKESLYENQEIMVKIAEQGFDGDVNKYTELGIDLTVFEGDTRVESSIANSVGTKASDVVIKEVLVGGHEYISRDVDVNGESYLGYYVPTENGMLFAGKSNESINETLSSMIKILVIICVISIVVFTVIILFVANLLSKLMNSSAEGLSNVSGGELIRKDFFEKKAITVEINEINEAAIKMVDNLREVVDKTTEVSTSLSATSKGVNDTATTVLNATNEISIAIEEIANGASDQSNAVQNMATNLTEITDDMNEAESNINDMTEYAENMENSSAEMKVKINESIVSMDKMSNGVNAINEQLQKTNELFEDVKKFIDIIDDIADQTKLLSINASIEAAHAGESGRGFAVVAENIKSMSDDTAKQAKEISVIIEGLIKDFAVCMKSISEIVDDNEKQKQSMDYVVSTFEVLDNNIKQTMDKMVEVEGHIKHVTNKCSSAASEAEEMTAIAENSAAATEEITASIQEVNATLHNLESEAKELAQDAELLEEEMRFFTV